MLASLDVESLYSNITHDLGIKAVEFFLSTKGLQFRRHNKFLLKLLEFILTKFSYVQWEVLLSHHRERNGCKLSTYVCKFVLRVMGGPPTSSQNVFTELYERFTDCILYWGRYIDDVMILWEGGPDLLKEFVEVLNNNYIGSSPRR